MKNSTSLSLTSREIVLSTTLGLSYGVLFFGWNYVYQYVGRGILSPIPLWGPILKELLTGMWFGAGVFVSYLLRKKGTATLGEFSAALLGSSLHFSLIDGPLLGLFQGLTTDCVFAIFGRYKNYKWPVVFLAGGMPAFTSFLINYSFHGYIHLPIWVQIGKLIARFISGAILGGLLAKTLGDSVLKTGILPYPPDKKDR